MDYYYNYYFRFRYPARYLNEDNFNLEALKVNSMAQQTQTVKERTEKTAFFKTVG